MKINTVGVSKWITQKELDEYQVEVGILKKDLGKKGNRAKNKKAGIDKSYKGYIEVKPPLRYIAGQSKKTIGEIAQELANQYGWIEKAYNNPNNKDIEAVANRLTDALAGMNNAKKRYLNACRALVVNPILRNEFGSNSPETQKRKGFNRPMVDTGKFVSSIDARFLKQQSNGDKS
ncbi:MAG: hypothetical protein LBT79_03610 [Elusimicrobiota bacterium]|jgi:hypothetical protein|nr:hypothetical protein [Elusimicrobiota bacterium]